MVRLSKITKRMLVSACTCNDLNEALQPLQQAAGIDSGDVAGRHFAGDRARAWPTATEEQRMAMLLAYIEVERIYA